MLQGPIFAGKSALVRVVLSVPIALAVRLVVRVSLSQHGRSTIIEGSIVKSPIAYFGGKSLLASRFVPLFPEHTRYVEVFGGGGSMLFAKSPSTFEVYNDLDDALFEFFSVLADPQQFGKFKRAVAALPLSRRLHIHCFRTWRTETKLVNRVAKWYVAMRQGFAGRLTESWGYSVTHGRGGMSQAVSKWLSGMDRLPEIHARLQSVQLDNRDFRKVLTAYDLPDTFFYLDPPYVKATRRGGEYRCEMTDDDHRDLVEQLLQLQGYALLSGYDSPLYRPLIKAGWQRREFSVTCSAAGRVRGSGLKGKGNVTKKQQRVEVVWANYALPAA